jgi:hypothetical protein
MATDTRLNTQGLSQGAPSPWCPRNPPSRNWVQWWFGTCEWTTTTDAPKRYWHWGLGVEEGEGVQEVRRYVHQLCQQ